MKKRVFALLLAFLMTFSLCACSPNTKDDAEGASGGEKVKITLLSQSSTEIIMNIVRDQLSKNGFEVELNIQPDYASFSAQQDAGNYDILITNWMTGPGNGDYAVRSLFTSTGDYNGTHISDPEVDRLVDLAASEVGEGAVEAYRQLEQVLIGDNAYITALFNSMKKEAYNKELMQPVRVKKGREPAWEQLDYIDPANRDTLDLIISNNYDVFTSLDPIKANDGSTIMENTNIYVRLMNLDDENVPTAEGSLSYQYAIAEGNSAVYFVLRDDINFAKVENMEAVDSGIMVGAEDVVFSLNRAKDPNSVPDHRTYSIHNAMKDVSIVTDISELEGTMTTESEDTILETLEAALDVEIAELVAAKDDVDNDAGRYQVVKVTTNTPYPQIINTLAHPSGGIVCKEQVERVNTYDMETYDPAVDVAYGDQSTYMEGSTYNNTLYCSGPYVPIYKNDYEMVFQKNPNYLKGTEHEPKIKTIRNKFIKNADTALAALRSGEVYYSKWIADNHLEILADDPLVGLATKPGNGVTYLAYNLSETSPCSNVNVRKAIDATINQEEIIAVYKNAVGPAYSTLSPVVDTGMVHTTDLEKAREYLALYWESLQ